MDMLVKGQKSFSAGALLLYLLFIYFICDLGSPDREIRTLLRFCLGKEKFWINSNEWLTVAQIIVLYII